MRRIQKKPERYGVALFDISNGSEEKELFSDDSVADENYSPEKDKTEKKNNSSSSLVDLNDSVKLIDFDIEFDKINDATSNQSNEARASEPQPVKSAAQLDSYLNDEGSSVPALTSFESKVLNQLQFLTDITKQMFARSAVIEESLLKNGTLASVKVKNSLNQHDKFHLFIKSSNMPFKTVDAFKAFEESLNEESIQNAVSNLKCSILLPQTINIFTTDKSFSSYRQVLYHMLLDWQH